MKSIVTVTSLGVKAEGALIGVGFANPEDAKAAFDIEVKKLIGDAPPLWCSPPEMQRDAQSHTCMIRGRLHVVVKGYAGWRATKGPQAANVSGFRATGHRLLLLPDPIETTTESGIVLTAKTVGQDKSKGVWATVLEIGCDAWSDKSTDYCEVGDRVLIGEYTGKFHTSPHDGKEYRFVNDLDIITALVPL